MKKTVIVSILIIALLLACRKESIDRDILYGKWIIESNTGHPRPTVEFNAGGEYCMVDYLAVPPGGMVVYRYIITGEYSLDGNRLTLLTANVESMDQESSGSVFTYMGLPVTSGSPIGSFYNSQADIGRGTVILPPIGTSLEYKPVTWEIISLTASLLEVITGPDTVRYVPY